MGLIFKNKVQETTFLFLKTITLKKESLLKTIIESLIDLFKKQNIEVATIKTAVKLEGKLEKYILSVIKEKASGSIELRKIIDKNIIGGQ